MRGPPRSSLYGDLYFSEQDGLAEARAVFLAGCGLPERWTGRGRFCVGELGFGTGLNIVALIDLWRRTRAPDAQLSIFSLEAHHLSRDEAAGALAAWPELAPVADRLIGAWPGRARGFHRLEWPDLGVTLDVAMMEVAAALGGWSGQADAWLLDGFAPARNPAMWTDAVLSLVAARSAPGARAATFTVAGQVRRGLEAAGFAVARAPGFGAKRERLEATWPGVSPAPPALPRVAIVGAGIAGASLARAFAAQGAAARVFDQAGPGAGASGGSAALVSPRLDAGLGPQAALFAQAFARAVDLYGQAGEAVIAGGALQLAIGPKDARRFAAIAGADLFEPGSARLADAAVASERLGEAAPGGLWLDHALVIEPARVSEAWLPAVETAAVAEVCHEDGEWRLLTADGEALASAEVVCLAAGMASGRLTPGLPLTAVRGQATRLTGPSWPFAALFGGWVMPTRDGVLIGATHDRGDEATDTRPEDHARNLAALAQVLPGLAARLAGILPAAETGVRAATSDYLPLAGAGPEAAAGLFVLSGLGSRGFTLAPLLAEHVVALALGAPSPLPRDLAALVDPARFAMRALRRRGESNRVAAR